MKRTLLLIVPLFFLFGCMQQENYGKKVVIELDIEQDAAGVIMLSPEGFSFESRDSNSEGKFDAEQVFDWQDLVALPLPTKQAIVEELTGLGVDVPQDFIDTLVPDVEPDVEPVVEPVVDDKKKLPLTVKTVGAIHIDGKYPMRYVVDGVCGPDLGDKFKITFSDGRELFINDSKKDSNTTAGRGYRPGCDYTSHKEVEWMEVYADPGHDAAHITIEAM